MSCSVMPGLSAFHTASYTASVFSLASFISASSAALLTRRQPAVTGQASTTRACGSASMMPLARKNGTVSSMPTVAVAWPMSRMTLATSA
ncbi:hypothetical protein D3C81_1877090 [compost metagenome]